MGQDKTGYVRDRMLIEASRILSPQFNALGVYLTGAQVELLRNAVNVLDKPTTFVDEYKLGYYTTPTDDDWDAIRSIVADLQRRLMGNENTPLGYFDRVFESISDLDVDAGTKTVQTTIVPLGYVHFIQAITMRNIGSEVNQTKGVATFTDAVILERLSPAAGGLWHPFTLANLTLGPGDSIEGTFYNCTSGDDLYLKVWGYKMKVPIYEE